MRIRFLAVVSVFALALGVVACGGSSEEASGGTGGNADSPLAVRHDGNFCGDEPLGFYDSPPLPSVADEFGFHPYEEGFTPHFYSCVPPGELIIAIEGLPAVSGVYRSTESAMELRGFGLENGDPLFDFDRCFIGHQGEPFQTLAVVSASGGEGNVVAVALTVDVGLTLGLGSPDGPTPFVGVTVHSITAAEYRMEHDFVQRSDIEHISRRIEVPGRNDFAGFASFTTDFYDAAQFFPHKGDSDNIFLGDPLYKGRVSVWCGG